MLTLYVANEDDNPSPPMVPSESLLYDREFLTNVFILPSDWQCVRSPPPTALPSPLTQFEIPRRKVSFCKHSNLFNIHLTQNSMRVKWNTYVEIYEIWSLTFSLSELEVGTLHDRLCHSLPLAQRSTVSEVSLSSISQEAECITSISSVLPLAPLPKVMQRTQHRGGEEGTQSRCQSPPGMNAAQEGPEGSVSASPQNRSLHLEPTSSLHIWIHLFSIEISLFRVFWSRFSFMLPSLASPSYLYPPSAEIIGMNYHI